MTDKTLIALGDEDGAIVFRADGVCELRFGKRAKQMAAPDHLVLMVGLHGMLEVEDFRQEVIELVDDAVAIGSRRKKAWSN